MHYKMTEGKIQELFSDQSKDSFSAVNLHNTMVKLRSMCIAHAGALRLMYGVVKVIESPEGLKYQPFVRYCDPIVTVQSISRLSNLAQTLLAEMEFEVNDNCLQSMVYSQFIDDMGSSRLDQIG